jgi:hypothetical protein
MLSLFISLTAVLLILILIPIILLTTAPRATRSDGIVAAGDGPAKRSYMPP